MTYKQSILLWCLAITMAISAQTHPYFIRPDVKRPPSVNKTNRLMSIHRLGESPASVLQQQTQKQVAAKENVQYAIQEVLLDDTVRITYEYGSRGKLFLQQYEIRSSNGWIPMQQMENYFDDRGNLTANILRQFQNNSWVDMYQYSYTYNNQGFLLTEEFAERIGTGLSNSWKTIHEYDERGNATAFIRQLWNNNAWVNENRNTFTYNSSGNLLTAMSEYWSNGMWHASFRYTLSYNEQNSLLNEVSEVFANNTWTPFAKDTYSYDNQQNRIQHTYELYNGGVWISRDVYTYTYDSLNRLVSGDMTTRISGVLTPEWRFNSSYTSTDKLKSYMVEFWLGESWGDAERFTYEYDARDNRIGHLSEDHVDGNWVPVSKYVYAIDNNDNTFRGESFIWTGNSWLSGEGDLQLTYNGGENTFSSHASVITIVYQTISGIEPPGIKPAGFVLEQNYPNPFNPSTTISYQLPNAGLVTLKIYDMVGKEIKVLVNEYKETGRYTVEFNATGLASGVYMYRLDCNDYHATKKLTLLK